MACHKMVLKALQRLLVEAFLESIVKDLVQESPKTGKPFFGMKKRSDNYVN